MKNPIWYRRHPGGLEACRMQAVRHSGKGGAILGIVMITLVVISVLVLSLYHLGAHSGREAEYELKSAQAFWLAEAGVQWCIDDMYDINGNNGLTPGAVPVGGSVPGTFDVVDSSTSTAEFRDCIGTVTVGGQTITRRIRIGLGFLIDHLNDVIRAENQTGVPWYLMLSGEKYEGVDGPRRPILQNNHYPGGNDVAIGNINVNGSVRMYDESLVDGLSAPNTYSIFGDVSYSGDFYQDASTSVAGSIIQTSSGDYGAPDLADMDYANNRDYDVAYEFSSRGITSGRLPVDHPLYNVVAINVHPEGDPTPGEYDYYFEPSYISGAGTPSTGSTPLVLGDDKTYYVDGHVWFHNSRTYGFEVDGQAVIVSTRDIHISDNLTYADRGRDPDSDMLALVALGQYSGDTHIDGTGNVYFGDPKYGTLYTCDAFMFANNDFLYNTWSSGSSSGQQEEPESGFKVFGNFMAMNRVVILRDWYKPDGSISYRAAEYVEVTDADGTIRWTWKDIADGSELTSTENNTRRHYAMMAEYDDRLRDVATQMSGLPKVTRGTIFAGMVSWEEI